MTKTAWARLAVFASGLMVSVCFQVSVAAGVLAFLAAALCWLAGASGGDPL